MTSDSQLRVAILVSGGGTNLQAIIDAVAAGELDIDIVAVVSDNPGAFGLQRAATADIPTTVVNFDDFAARADFDMALDSALVALKPDLIVLAGYMRILAAATVTAYAGRMLNIHPSLLPAYPGLHTYRRVLAAGDDWHGTTVHFVIPELDAGPAILQYRVRVQPHDTEPTLRERVQQGEYIIYPRVIDWIASGRLTMDRDTPILDGEVLREPIVQDEIEQ